MKQEEQLISIITPVYNAEDFLSRTKESVFGQHYTNWEWLLVDDCSQDQSAAMIKSWKDPRVKLIRLEQNSGAAVARNTALEAAQGRFVAFIDSDDYWAPNKLGDQLTFMKEEGYVFTYTNLAFISEDGKLLRERINLPQELDYSGLLKNTAIACSTVMLDRKEVGDFRMPLVRKGQDTATWLKLMREHGINAYLFDEVLTYYRQVAGSISSNKLGAIKRTWNTYYYLEDLPLPKALYYFMHYLWNAVSRRL